MSLTPAKLESNNIRFDPNYPSRLGFPRHVRVLTDLFLDSKGTIQDRFDLQDDDDPWTVHNHSIWMRLSSEEKDSINKVINGAEQVQELAHKSHGEKNWNLFDHNQGFRKDDRKNLSKPRPDRACYFTIHNIKSNDMEVTTRKFKWKETAQSKLVENFSLEILDRLVKFGLQACPLSRYTVDSYRPKDLQCFPWLIVEHKRNDEKEREKCYCQAANDSAAALMLLQTAATFAEIKDEGRHVPPIVAVTTVGHVVRVWIAYHHPVDGEDHYDLRTIWSGKMNRVWDILKFEAILENLHSWATRGLKPQLSMYIDQWRNRFLDEDLKYGISMSNLQLKLQDLNKGEVTRMVDLAKTLDEVMTIAFDRGRQSTRIMEHEHASHFANSSHNIGNEELLAQLEKIDTKINGLQVSLANTRATELEESLSSSLMLDESDQSSGPSEHNHSQGTSEVQQTNFRSEPGQISPATVSTPSDTLLGKKPPKVSLFENTETLSSSVTRNTQGSYDSDGEKAQAISSTEEQSQGAAMDRSKKIANAEAVDSDLTRFQHLQRPSKGKIFDYSVLPPTLVPSGFETRTLAAPRSFITRRSASPSLRYSAQSDTGTHASAGLQSEGDLPLPLSQKSRDWLSLRKWRFADDNVSNLSVPTLTNRQRSSSAGPTVSTDIQQSKSHNTAIDLTDSSLVKTKVNEEGEQDRA
ncbi:MAG: hypothetical protein Q9227_007577 [Pyrenula ochraceoflavens]